VTVQLCRKTAGCSMSVQLTPGTLYDIPAQLLYYVGRCADRDAVDVESTLCPHKNWSP